MRKYGYLSIILYACNALAISATDIMSQNWNANKLFESNLSSGLVSTVSLQKPIKSGVLVVKKNLPANSVDLYGFGVVHDGIYDLNEDTHVVFYIDAVVLKLDY